MAVYATVMRRRRQLQHSPPRQQRSNMGAAAARQEEAEEARPRATELRTQLKEADVVAGEPKGARTQA
jgi:hypothetical protein